MKKYLISILLVLMSVSSFAYESICQSVAEEAAIDKELYSPIICSPYVEETKLIGSMGPLPAKEYFEILIETGCAELKTFNVEVLNDGENCQILSVKLVSQRPRY